MIELALAAALLLALALLARAERTIRRERVEAAAMLARKSAEAAAERVQAAEERRELYQRIQAPEIAVQEAHRERRGEPRPRRPIAADDDAAFLARNKAAAEGVKDA